MKLRKKALVFSQKRKYYDTMIYFKVAEIVAFYFLERGNVLGRSITD